MLYVFTSIMYRRFIGMLMDALSGSSSLTDGTFVMLYNMTHGFKYLEMLSAILLGVVMTGIFLNDRAMKLSSFAILALFLISFAVLQMQTVNLMGREVGIVWTSIIYHITETVGLVLLFTLSVQALQGPVSIFHLQVTYYSSVIIRIRSSPKAIRTCRSNTSSDMSKPQRIYIIH